MKKNTYLFVALLSAGLVACNNEPSFNVEGTVAGAADKMLYLEQTGLEGIVALDSVKLGDGGSFHFPRLGRMRRISIGFVWVTR